MALVHEDNDQANTNAGKVYLILGKIFTVSDKELILWNNNEILESKSFYIKRAFAKQQGFTWTASYNAPWITGLSATSGTVDDDEPVNEITVHVDRTGLTEGTYEDEVVISVGGFSKKVKVILINNDSYNGNNDITPPNNITNFIAMHGDEQITLSWNNPDDSDFAGVKILRKTSGYPTSPTDGTVVYNSTGTSYTDTSLINGAIYYYKAFSYDNEPNYASGIRNTATPRNGGETRSIIPINYGIACQENATDTGYIMYSHQDVFTRFIVNPDSHNSDHLIAVKYISGFWRYDNNGSYYIFPVQPTDVLIAEVDFSNDTINDLQGVSGSEYGIEKGYQNGDLTFHANWWNGVANPGEFTVDGTYFITNGSGVDTTPPGIVIILLL